MNKKDKEFLKDLESLLRKHDVSIWFNYAEDSDTNGMFGECIVITHNKTRKEIFRVDDYGMAASDIKEAL